MTNSNKGGMAIVIAAGLIMLQNASYGFGNPISKVAYETLPVFSLLVARYGIALIPLLIFFGRRTLKQLRVVSPKVWLGPSICITLCYLFGNIALGITAATTASFLSGIAVIFAPILALVLHRTKYPLRNLPILALLIIGLYLLCALGGVATFGIGEAVSLLASVSMAGSLVLGSKALDEIDPIALTTTQIGISFIAAIVCALFVEHGVHLSAATPKVWAIIIYLAWACSVLGFALQNTALKYAPATFVAVAQTLCPVFTAAFSFPVLGEALSPAGMLGAAIILGCVIATVLLDSRDA